MKAAVIFIAIIGVAIAQSNQRTSDADAYIVRYANDNNSPLGYKFGFDTSNGIRHDEQGTLTNPGTENEAMEVVGGYEYVDPLNRKVTVTYTAGVNGFVPVVTYS
ncbi:hypothetical protein RN001_008627 [Aquatica leii]|uniref:Uncharacterized protein n=1 Tax=Aquatica leii TaxID=1421715 RepID=A0AAN7PDJ6_9COLE|nr:hypothetical protein RN001_008627 [Aquatica leii]